MEYEIERLQKEVKECHQVIDKLKLELNNQLNNEHLQAQLQQSTLNINELLLEINLNHKTGEKST